MTRSTSFVAAVATAALTVGLAGLAAPATAKAPAKKVTITLKAAKPVVEKGKSVKLTGKVTPRKGVKGLRLVIQQKIDGKDRWTRTGTATVKKSGRFTFTEKPRTTTVREYRAIVPRPTTLNKTTFKKARSPKVTVAVAEWRSLTSQYVVDSDWVSFDTAQVNGVRYPMSVQSDEYGREESPSYLEVNLLRKCYRLRTAAALTDHSGRTPTSARIFADDVLRNTTPLTTLGASTPVTVDVTAAFRVRFEIDRPEVTTGLKTRGAFLSPEVLCSQ